MYNQKRIKMYIYSYRPEDLIGSGYNSQVFKGQNDVNGDIVAIKVCDHSRVQHQIEKQLFLQEIAALQVLDSLNIVKMPFYIHNKYCTYIVTEYCNQCDLENMIMKRGYIPENQAILIFYQILTGLKDQISKGVIHADLKPSNILIQKGIYKIANYGHSRMIYSQNQQVQYNVSTTLYNQTQTSVKNDIWNLGESYLGRRIENKNLLNFHKNPIQFSDNIIILSAAKDLINKCLQLDENKRYNCNQLLEHDLFKCFQIKTLKKQIQMLINNCQLGNQINRTNTSCTQELQYQSIQRLQSRNNQKEIRQEFMNYGDAVYNILNLHKLILRIQKIIDNFKQLKKILNENHSTIYQTKKDDFINQNNNMNDTFRTSFKKLWDYIYKDETLYNEIVKDKKFAAVFDESELEVVSFYIIMLSYLRNSITLLQNQLNFKLMNFKNRINQMEQRNVPYCFQYIQYYIRRFFIKKSQIFRIQQQILFFQFKLIG
ncbi:unnamed protein product [Paramecium primaurelia]|uniref:Protein kinase domain-containing protein n=1 Tax=Paramecium primaurelia TaxID=5886 RepID=A0A8S1NLC6_PARPR|nr:unnamed protein product [Paramecium primaurelia]